MPKAYINYILLDDQFKFAGGGASRVGTSGVVKDHWTDGLQNINVTKSGYLFVYVSNESNFNVFFDNVEVVHTRGAILEETHYYPFGLIMAGISSRALNNAPENKRKWNKGSELENKEFSDGSGLEMYATQLRSLDPQLGRWWQKDSKPDYAKSLYSSMNNNPIFYNDPLGDTVKVRTGFLGLRKLTYDENSGKLYKRNGKEYTGNNEFAKSVSTYLNKVNSTGIGGKVIGEMSASTNSYIFVNKGTNKAVAAFVGNSNDGGGKIFAGGLMNGNYSEATKVEGTAHELFHGYQQMYGNTGQTINREVESYVFGQAVRKEAGYAMPGSYGYETTNGYIPGIQFNNSFMNLLNGSSFNQADFNTAVDNFKLGSLFNNKWNQDKNIGVYDSFSINPNYKPLIGGLYPLTN